MDLKGQFQFYYPVKLCCASLVLPPEGKYIVLCLVCTTLCSVRFKQTTRRAMLSTRLQVHHRRVQMLALQMQHCQQALKTVKSSREAALQVLQLEHKNSTFCESNYIYF